MSHSSLPPLAPAYTGDTPQVRGQCCGRHDLRVDRATRQRQAQGSNESRPRAHDKMHIYSSRMHECEHDGARGAVRTQNRCPPVSSAPYSTATDRKDRFAVDAAQTHYTARRTGKRPSSGTHSAYTPRKHREPEPAIENRSANNMVVLVPLILQMAPLGAYTHEPHTVTANATRRADARKAQRTPSAA